mgnify:CR=1 FL=1
MQRKDFLFKVVLISYCVAQTKNSISKMLVRNFYRNRNWFIENPKNKKSMNGMLVCVRFDNNDAMNRKIVSYIVEE